MHLGKMNVDAVQSRQLVALPECTPRTEGIWCSVLFWTSQHNVVDITRVWLLAVSEISERFIIISSLFNGLALHLLPPSQAAAGHDGTTHFHACSSGAGIVPPTLYK